MISKVYNRAMIRLVFPNPERNVFVWYAGEIMTPDREYSRLERALINRFFAAL